MTVKPSLMSKRLYQFQIPLFIVSFLTGLLIIQYFFSWKPLDDVAKGLNVWSSLVTGMTLLYASFVLTLMNIRTVMRRRSFKEVFRSASYLGFLVVMLALGFSSPQLTSGTLFRNVYTPITALIGACVWFNSETGLIWASIQRLSVINSFDVALLWITAIITALRNLTAITAVYPPINDLGIWIYMVPDRTARNAATAAAAIGAVVLALRALIGKEPGLVEMELK
jgi:hypothetical protein